MPLSGKIIETKDYCEKLISENKQHLINDKTGLVIDSYFSSTKIKWILENVPMLNYF